MLIPVLGTFSGAWWLGEQLHWQDDAAIVLVLVAIASVMLPVRGRREAEARGGFVTARDHDGRRPRRA